MTPPPLSHASTHPLAYFEMINYLLELQETPGNPEQMTNLMSKVTFSIPHSAKICDEAFS